MSMKYTLFVAIFHFGCCNITCYVAQSAYSFRKYWNLIVSVVNNNFVYYTFLFVFFRNIHRVEIGFLFDECVNATSLSLCLCLHYELVFHHKWADAQFFMVDAQFFGADAQFFRADAQFFAVGLL